MTCRGWGAKPWLLTLFLNPITLSWGGSCASPTPAFASETHPRSRYSIGLPMFWASAGTPWVCYLYLRIYAHIEGSNPTSNLPTLQSLQDLLVLNRGASPGSVGHKIGKSDGCPKIYRVGSHLGPCYKINTGPSAPAATGLNQREG